MRRSPFPFLASTLCGLCACNETAAPPSTPQTAPHPSAAVNTGADSIELVESVPAETTLDHADVRDAPTVWPEMIDRAKTTIDFAEFYASDAENGAATPLGPVLAAIGRATKRGVKVRFVADKGMSSKYPAMLDQITKLGVTVRTIDAATRYGGVQHAKFFVVDGHEAFVGSQNFDWRALQHIQEMGVRMESPAISGALEDLFETDWALAETATPAATRTKGHGGFTDTAAKTGESFALFESPKGWLPDESRWDLDGIVALLDGAKAKFDLQVLTYSTTNRDKSPFTTLDDAVRRAAGRGVKVRLLVSSWGTKGAARKAIDGLAGVANVEVKVLTVPPASTGDIPFARVSHAKFFIVDGTKAWVGTSNWEGDYFLKTRNVAIVAQNGALPPRLDRIFEDDWTSAYAQPLSSLPAAAAPPSGSGPARH